MVSSSLSGRRYRGSYPPYCIPRPPPGPVVPPGVPALKLQAYARWTDLDPLAPGDQAHYFHLDRVGPGNIYFGESAYAGDRLNILIDQFDAQYFWDVTIEVWDYWRTPETYTWLSVFVPPNLPFDTRLLEQIHVPDKDYRQVRVTA